MRIADKCPDKCGTFLLPGITYSIFTQDQVHLMIGVLIRRVEKLLTSSVNMWGNKCENLIGNKDAGGRK